MVISSGWWSRTGRCRDGRGVFEDVLQVRFFEHHRLRELFTGFSGNDYDERIPYPGACHPQAWVAGAVPFLMQTSLGLEGDGFNRRPQAVAPK
jgi:glycogen debranching enzyme